MFEQISIRPALPTEAHLLSAIATRTFQDAFADSSDPADIADYLRDHCSAKCFAHELANQNNLFLLAFAAETSAKTISDKTTSAKTTAPIGYAKLRKSSPEHPTESCISGAHPIELERLYVEKAAIGQGVGAQLMQACLNQAKSMAYDTLWLGVWEHNARALKFYQRWGFEAVGSHVFVVGSDEQNDLIMQKSLS